MDILEKMTGNVSENTACWNAVETAIKSSGVDVPEGTPKSEYGDKVAEVFEAGQKSEYDRFWDRIQKNGEPANYEYRFWIFPADLYDPKYDLIFGVSAYSANFSFGQFGGTDLKKNLDLTSTTVATMSRTFSQSKIVNARTIKVRPQLKYNNTFTKCYALEEVRFEGVIGQAGLSFQDSTKLSKESIESVINHLSATTTELTVTFSKTAVNNSFETTAGAADGTTSQEWADLIATKSNWTISLV